MRMGDTLTIAPTVPDWLYQFSLDAGPTRACASS